jgi:hypothetical protein
VGPHDRTLNMRIGMGRLASTRTGGMGINEIDVRLVSKRVHLGWHKKT